MENYRLISRAVPLVLVLATAACFLLQAAKSVEAPYHAREPSYDGRSLREWLHLLSFKPRIGHMYDDLAPYAGALNTEDHVFGIGAETAEQQLAKRAIRSIGPAAVPFLLEMLGRGGAEARDAVTGFATLGDLGKAALPELQRLLDEPDLAIRYLSIWAIGRIGPAAANAIPALLRDLESSPQPHVPAEALGNIGPAAAEAVPLILEMLSSGNLRWDEPLITALGKLGSKSAIPALLAIAKGADSRGKTRGEYSDHSLERRRHRAVDALGTMGPAAADAVPMLVELLKLQGRGDLIRVYFAERIIQTLGEIGPDAREAIPVLRAIRDQEAASPEHSRQGIGQFAASALARIETESVP